jgi:hypothetical protein
MTDYTHKRKHPKQKRKVMGDFQGKMLLLYPAEIKRARERYQRKYGRPTSKLAKQRAKEFS